MIKNTLRKISDWLDYNPPGALSSRGWRLFNLEYKENAPLRYWFRNDFRRKFIYPIKWKKDAISRWIRYRTYDRYHVIKTDLEPDYHSVATQMLHANFTLLKDFVEVEQAWMSHRKRTWFQRTFYIYNRYTFRNPQLGIDHFKWAATLDDPALPPHERCDHQAIAAREVLDLYDWWVNRRPARKDIFIPDYNKQGTGNDILACFDTDFDREAEDYKAHVEAMDAQSALEDEWQEEDDAMLARLIKIRHQLWT